jgi:hypothetical protein
VALAAVCPGAGVGGIQSAHAAIRDAGKRIRVLFTLPVDDRVTVWLGMRIAYSSVI